MIIFRGISKETNEFIYGSLLQMNDQSYIHKNGYGDIQDIDFGYSFEEVSNKTVGQYTGEYDIAYIKIYSGDVIVKVVKEIISVFPEKIKDIKLTGEVIFNGGKFIVVCEDINQSFDLYEFCKDGIKIGNIHENPELLKVTK